MQADRRSYLSWLAGTTGLFSYTFSFPKVSFRFGSFHSIYLLDRTREESREEVEIAKEREREIPATLFQHILPEGGDQALEPSSLQSVPCALNQKCHHQVTNTSPLDKDAVGRLTVLRYVPLWCTEYVFMAKSRAFG